MPPKKVAAKCLYDVLELAGDCEDEAVKKAYRKMALQWHPGVSCFMIVNSHHTTLLLLLQPL